jgi:flagellar biosynthesis GTPase FlhF
MEALKAAQDANAFMMGELRAMRAMMKERFDTMAFVEKLGRTPAQAALAQKLLDGGFSAVLIRKMLDAMPAEVIDGTHDEVQWATQVLQRNLNTADRERAIEDQGGVFALIGSTGVGKTTTTAKLAATFAAKHGASNLGLITLDAYRVGAHEQLRAYGRILGVPVHMAHDRAALEDLLELLSGKKMILIDTAGMAQRDGRTKELLDLLAHPSIKKLLVINTAAQGDAIEDVMHAYQANACAGVILSKLDEAVKLGPALDALIRHKLKVLGVANGQRVPEDWHRLSSQALVHRALRASLNPAYRLDPTEVSLVFSTPSPPSPRRPPAPCEDPPFSLERSLLPFSDCADERHVRPQARFASTCAPAPVDQAQGLRQMFVSRVLRFIPVVANGRSACGGLVLERLCAAYASFGLNTLVVDASDQARAPSELVAFDLSEGIETLSTQVSYMAARGLPLRHADARGSCASLLPALADASPRSDVVLVHASASEIVRLFSQPCARHPPAPLGVHQRHGRGPHRCLRSGQDPHPAWRLDELRPAHVRLWRAQQADPWPSAWRVAPTISWGGRAAPTSSILSKPPRPTPTPALHGDGRRTVARRAAPEPGRFGVRTPGVPGIGLAGSRCLGP